MFCGSFQVSNQLLVANWPSLTAPWWGAIHKWYSRKLLVSCILCSELLGPKNLNSHSLLKSCIMQEFIKALKLQIYLDYTFCIIIQDMCWILSCICLLSFWLISLAFQKIWKWLVWWWESKLHTGEVCDTWNIHTSPTCIGKLICNVYY